MKIFNILKLSESQPFCLIYKQMNDILDDPNDFERFYLTADLYEYLKKNLHTMVNIIEYFFILLLSFLKILF